MRFEIKIATLLGVLTDDLLPYRAVIDNVVCPNATIVKVSVFFFLLDASKVFDVIPLFVYPVISPTFNSNL